MRSAGQTGPNTTVPFTPEPERTGTMVGGAVVASRRPTVVVVVSAGREAPEGSGTVDDVGAVAVGRAWPPDRNAESCLPQAVPRRRAVTTRLENRSLRIGKRTSTV